MSFHNILQKKSLNSARVECMDVTGIVSGGGVVLCITGAFVWRRGEERSLNNV